MSKQANSAVAVSASAFLLLSAVGAAEGGILPLNVTGVSAAATSSLTDVRYRRGGAVAAGIAFGLLGAAIASQYHYSPYYYYPPYAPYAPPVYYYPPYASYGYYPAYPYYGSFGPYWGRPYIVRHVYPRYRYYGVRHYYPRHYRARHRVRR